MAEIKRTAAVRAEHRFRAAPGDMPGNKKLCGSCLVGLGGEWWKGWVEGKVLGALSRNVLSRRPPSLGVRWTGAGKRA